MNRQFLTAFVDALLLMVVCVFAMLLIAVTMMRKQAESRTDDPPVNAGQVQVIAVWDPSLKSDVDLWVRAPRDRVVGYTQKNGRVFDLLRDDLGDQNDLSGLNIEDAFTRGAPAGEYVVNLHWFRDNDGRGPITVRVVGQLRLRPELGTSTLFAQDVVLQRQGDEETVMRFTLDADGRVVSTSRLPVYIAVHNTVSGVGH